MHEGQGDGAVDTLVSPAIEGDLHSTQTQEWWTSGYNMADRKCRGLITCSDISYLFCPVMCASCSTGIYTLKQRKPKDAHNHSISPYLPIKLLTCTYRPKCLPHLAISLPPSSLLSLYTSLGLRELLCPVGKK